MKYDMEEKMSNGFSFDTTKFVLGEVKKEALKTAMEEIAELFGDRTYLKSGNYANSGLKALAEYQDKRRDFFAFFILSDLCNCFAVMRS